MLSNRCSEGAYKLTIERRLLKNESIINKMDTFLLATVSSAERLRRNQIEIDLGGHVDAQTFLSLVSLLERLLTNQSMRFMFARFQRTSATHKLTVCFASRTGCFVRNKIQFMFVS